MRYICGTLDYGLQLYSSSTTFLIAYSDADWVGCSTNRQSTSCYCVFLANNLLSWSFKRQVTLSRSIAKDEYRGVANAGAETCLLRNLLRELHTPVFVGTFFILITLVPFICPPIMYSMSARNTLRLTFNCS